MTERIVIAGAGHAAGQIVATLRQQKFAGQIVLVGDEPYLPYQRPPLSKKFLAGDMPAERLYVKPASFYEDPQIEIQLNTTITAIDRNAKKLEVEDGDDISYDKLVISLGSRVRSLPVEGADLKSVHYVRSIADVEGIRAELDVGKRLVVIGAGYIGLEVAAVARKLGLDVTVVEMADRVMSRVVSPEISDFYQIEHANQAVKLRLSTNVAALRGKKRVKRVDTADGEEIPADLVVVGVGILPNTEIAEEAGLDVDNGIVVDDRCQTSDPDIYAVGDCTAHPNAIYGRRIRLESVHNALEQAKTAASNLCGKETHYSDVPWFWSDQYDLKLQIAGLSEGYDDVVIRGNPAERSFACIYLREGRIIAVDAVNAPKDFLQSKALIAARTVISTDKLADAETSLKELATDA
ncbi:MAG: FAD-dependent oxidoreductase [Gammaproteobacteria bacterium]|nr:FAD-dependent oxidoreductase [Gammaproteobacteria bacterium]MBU2678503.1 FAD-dependent oxidoreductase [Gammaproteobacteria bacterium]NNC56897.1 FAD-dependent oxidoreductase [Woeseiaceae bacterium]NNL52238.1 FAD-dependent oxidoreductase [Woeseiaceae bacterium]